MSRVITCLFLAILTGSVSAQRPGPEKWFKWMEQNREISEYEKKHRSTLTEFRPAVQEARKSTVRIHSKGNQVALGTVLSKDGYLLTKASEVEGKELTAILHYGPRLKVKLVDTLDDYDLGLLKIDEEALTKAEEEAAGDDEIPAVLTPVVFSEREMPLGAFLAASDIDELPACIGVLSVLPRALTEKDKGFLGVSVVDVENGARVAQIIPQSAAEEADIRPDDVIVAINEIEIKDRDMLISTIANFQPEDEVTIHLLRKSRRLSLTVILKDRESGMAPFKMPQDRTSRMGGSLSKNRSQYPMAMQHDLMLEAKECGGPVVNLYGETVGVNIARAGRVKSYAIPGATLNQIVRRSSKSGKFRFIKSMKTLKADLEKADSTIENLRKLLSEAEARRESAMEALQEAEADETPEPSPDKSLEAEKPSPDDSTEKDSTGEESEVDEGS
ncbi:MAG: PDZ domain-containing protein [Verrucomicrobiota bacterium]